MILKDCLNEFLPPEMNMCQSDSLLSDVKKYKVKTVSLKI